MYKQAIQILFKRKSWWDVILNCDDPDPEVLDFLLTHLPRKANDQGFLSLESGQNALNFTNDAVLKANVFITTTHALVLRKSKKHQDEWRLAVIDAGKFGEKSAFSSVHLNTKTFRYKNKQVVTTTKPRLYKLFSQNDKRKSDETYRYSDMRVHDAILLEREIQTRLPYLKATKFYQDTSAGSLIFGHFEALLSGVTYRSLDVSNYSIGERIQLACALIEAVAIVTAAGIIHADLKPANIIVSQVGSQFSARLIDFNLSKLASDKTPNVSVVGSPLYLGPEAFDGRVLDVKSDVFSLGIILALCFGATLSHFKKVQQIFASFSEPYKFMNLFQGINDATPQQRLAIYLLLTAMVRHDLEKRLSIAEVSEAFEALANGRTPACLQKQPVSVESPQMFFNQPQPTVNPVKETPQCALAPAPRFGY